MNLAVDQSIGKLLDGQFKPCNRTSKKQPVASTRKRCTTELHFALLLTYTFESQLRRKLIGSRRHIAVSQLDEMPPPNQPFRYASEGRQCGVDFIKLSTRDQHRSFKNFPQSCRSPPVGEYHDQVVHIRRSIYI